MRPIITTSTSNNQYSEHTVPSSPTASHEGATDVPHQAHHHPHNDDTTTTTTTTPTVELRQRLMVADEVYLYKIPPLQTSGGHRYVFIYIFIYIFHCVIELTHCDFLHFIIFVGTYEHEL